MRWKWLTKFRNRKVGKYAKKLTPVAREVIQGKWGTGLERRDRLSAAGYDYDKVQKEINEFFKEVY